MKHERTIFKKNVMIKNKKRGGKDEDTPYCGLASGKDGAPYGF